MVMQSERPHILMADPVSQVLSGNDIIIKLLSKQTGLLMQRLRASLSVNKMPPNAIITP